MFARVSPRSISLPSTASENPPPLIHCSTPSELPHLVWRLHEDRPDGHANVLAPRREAVGDPGGGQPHANHPLHAAGHGGHEVVAARANSLEGSISGVCIHLKRSVQGVLVVGEKCNPDKTYFRCKSSGCSLDGTVKSWATCAQLGDIIQSNFKVVNRAQPSLGKDTSKR